MSPRRVAVSQRVVEVPSHGETRDCLDQEWTTWLASLGLLAVPIPNRCENVAEFCDAVGVSAIMLSGGNNIHGPFYEDGSDDIAGTSPTRDLTENALIDFAIERRMPLIAWCRGMQLLQTHFGGLLSRTSQSTIEHVADIHDVEFTSEHFAGLTGAATMSVNSYHDFGVRRDALAPPLTEVAVASDGFVEAVSYPGLPLFGCQWHPERSGGCDDFNSALVASMMKEGDLL